MLTGIPPMRGAMILNINLRNKRLKTGVEIY